MEQRFERTYGAEPTLLTRAPGRVNLIGEHTDYNGGHVLPMALPFDTVIAAQRLPKPVVEVASGDRSKRTIDLQADPARTEGWPQYIHGMFAELAVGTERAGWRGVIETDIPTGASLSSSASLEVCSGLLFLAAADQAVDLVEIAWAGHRVENQLLGLPSGIMDQLISATARRGHATLIDCATLAATELEIDPSYRIAVMDTGTRRRLVDSEFADRRATCQAAAQQIGVEHLANAQLDDLASLQDDVTLRRARHIITEEARTLEAAGAIETADYERLGSLMCASHQSLRDDYEVSSPALDAVVAIAEDTPGCIGARMTGGGFAGCAIALIEASAAETFASTTLSRFREHATNTGPMAPNIYVVEPGPGAEILRS